MAITLQLTATDDIEITATNDNIILNGASVEFYKSAGHLIKFTEWKKGAAGAASGWVSAEAGGSNRRIFLHNTYDKIPLYWDPVNGNVKVWGAGTSYVTGSPGSLIIGTDNNVYECQINHSGLADTRPITGANWYLSGRWTLNTTDDNGKKCVLINDFS